MGFQPLQRRRTERKSIGGDEMANLSKLTVMLSDAELAQMLVDAGLDTPVGIEQATDETITTAVGSENLAAVRVVFPEPQE